MKPNLLSLAIFLGMTLKAFAAPPVHVQAHRGASAERLENTLPAFERAIEIGATSIELDVHLTKDGHLVVFHDFKVSPAYAKGPDGRPIPRELAIRDLTLAQLKAMDIVDAHRLKGPDISTPESRKVPTLEEVFKLFRESPDPHAREMMIDIEIKSEAANPQWSPPPPEFAKAVLDAIRKNWKLEKTIVRSFDHRTLKEARKLEPRLVISALTDEGFRDFKSVADDVNPNIISPSKKALTPEAIKQLHDRGIQVIPYTVNTPEEFRRYLAMGCDGLTTDDPKGFREWLEANGRQILHPSACKFTF